MKITYVWLDDGCCDKDGMGIEVHVSLSEERSGTVCLDAKKGDPLFADIICGQANGEAKTDGERIYWENGASLSLEEVLDALSPFPSEEDLPPPPCVNDRKKLVPLAGKQKIHGSVKQSMKSEIAGRARNDKGGQHMNQMQSFIEKVKTDTDLMTKLNALGASGASMDKVVALAAEHGFTVSEEDCRMATQTPCPHKKGELAEEELEAAAGGNDSRHDHAICSQYKETHYNCVGFLGLSHCYHYKYTIHRDAYAMPTSYEHHCIKGYFKYSVKAYY